MAGTISGGAKEHNDSERENDPENGTERVHVPGEVSET